MKQYQVAISFAGEQRGYAEELANHLQRRGVILFYDDFERAQLWGENLAERLYSIYAKQSEYVLMLVSKEYIDKKWCVHERRAAFDKMLNEKRNAILPVKFDDSWPEGLPTSTGWQEHTTPPAQLAVLVCEKLGVKPPPKLSDVPPPRMSALVGEVAFDYSDFNGHYVLGTGKLEFETIWHQRGGDSIYLSNNAPSIRGIAVAEGVKEFAELADVTQYNFSSSSRAPHTGELIVLRNVSDFYAVLRIKSVESKSHGGRKNEVRIFYVIGEDGRTDFSKYGVLE